MPRSVLARDVVVGVSSLVVIGAVTASLRLLPGVSPTTAALVLLLVVLGVATMARLRIAVIVSVLATLTLNFFFLPPIGAFTIADPQHPIALLVFVLVAVVASNLSASALLRQKAELAETLLASLSHDLRTPSTVIKVAVENLRGDLPGRPACTGRGGDRRARSVDTAGPGSPRDGTHRRGRDPDRTAVGRSRRRGRCRCRPRQTRAAGACLACRSGQGQRGRDRSARRVGGAVAVARERGAVFASHGEILVRARVESDGLHIAVTDQGPGLDPQELDRIFERFYRGRASRHAASGTGMGLSIARGLVAAVGGRVWAENVPGAGARFTLVVPGATRVVTAAH